MGPQIKFLDDKLEQGSWKKEQRNKPPNKVGKSDDGRQLKFNSRAKHLHDILQIFGQIEQVAKW